jgi:hypothetical protein
MYSNICTYLHSIPPGISSSPPWPTAAQVPIINPNIQVLQAGFPSGFCLALDGFSGPHDSKNLDVMGEGFY